MFFAAGTSSSKFRLRPIKGYKFTDTYIYILVKKTKSENLDSVWVQVHSCQITVQHVAPI
jgi:hypothetical protein